MKTLSTIALLASTISVILLLNQSASAEKINVSYQSRETALPLYIATEKGFWQEADLEPSISVFVSGPPQIAAMASWDVGITGGPPAALGAARFGLLTIAIATDESALNAMVMRTADADLFLKSPEGVKGKQLLVTTNTTAEYAALACLKQHGIAKSDVQIVNLAPAQIISAFSNDSGAMAVTWTPFLYALEDKGGMTEVCSGKSAGATIISTFVARSDFAKSRPDLVAKALAVYLRAVSWMKAHPADAEAYLAKYNAKNGVVLSEASLHRTIERSETFTLQQELQKFDRSAGSAQVDKWMNDLSAYLVATGTLQSVQDPKSYIDAQFLEAIQNDSKLRAFADGK